MKTIKQLIERLDTEVEMVCCDSARADWQTLKTKVLAQQTHNSESAPLCKCGDVATVHKCDECECEDSMSHL